MSDGGKEKLPEEEIFTEPGSEVEAFCYSDYVRE